MPFSELTPRAIKVRQSPVLLIFCEIPVSKNWLFSGLFPDWLFSGNYSLLFTLAFLYFCVFGWKGFLDQLNVQSSLCPDKRPKRSQNCSLHVQNSWKETKKNSDLDEKPSQQIRFRNHFVENIVGLLWNFQRNPSSMHDHCRMFAVCSAFCWSEMTSDLDHIALAASTSSIYFIVMNRASCTNYWKYRKTNQTPRDFYSQNYGSRRLNVFYWD